MYFFHSQNSRFLDVIIVTIIKGKYYLSSFFWGIFVLEIHYYRKKYIFIHFGLIIKYLIKINEDFNFLKIYYYWSSFEYDFIYLFSDLLFKSFIENLTNFIIENFVNFGYIFKHVVYFAIIYLDYYVGDHNDQNFLKSHF